MKTNKEVLDSIVKTVQMGQCGIRCVQDRVIGTALQQAMHDQLKEYDSIEKEAYDLAHKKGWEMQPLNPTIERMSSMMAKMQLTGNNTDSKIAKMLVQGNTRGMIKGYKNLNHSNRLEPDVDAIAQKLLSREKENIRQSCRFL